MAVGLYDVRLRDPQGKEYSTTFATTKEAEEFERGEKVACDRGAWSDPRRALRPFTTVAEEWLSGCK
jgi:hypothetical protein